MDEDTVENTLEILKSEIDESTEEIDRLLRRIKDLTDDEVAEKKLLGAERSFRLWIKNGAKSSSETLVIGV